MRKPSRLTVAQALRDLTPDGAIDELKAEVARLTAEIARLKAELECSRQLCEVHTDRYGQARAELAQSLTDEERLQIARLRTEIYRMQVAAERRNRDLAALHLVWCDGGCEGGVHWYDGLGPEAITQEIVDAAVRNTERLQRWWANRLYRLAPTEESEP